MDVGMVESCRFTVPSKAPAMLAKESKVVAELVGQG